jgi:hypothetical protein
MKSIAILLFAGVLPVGAQWLDYHDAKTPRTKDGKPDLSAPVPRIDGKPDLSGVWEAERTPVSEFTRVLGDRFVEQQVDYNDVTKHMLNVFWGLKPSEEPLRPEAVAIMKQRAGLDTPSASCWPTGIPASLFVLGLKIVQSPDEIVMLLGNGDPTRQIHTDGRSLPDDPQPAWMGYSVGKWDGDTLVVETTGFNENSWLDAFGHPRSESMRIRERYRRRDFGHMNLEVTIEDPKYYTKPFTFSTQLNWTPQGHLLEYVCEENEKDRVHAAKR